MPTFGSRLPKINGLSRFQCRIGEVGLSALSTTAQLALVDDACAEVEFGFGDDCDEAACQANESDVYVCRVLAANQAHAFQDAIATAGTHIEAGDTFQTTWDNRFNALAKASIKLVSIIDRYAIGQHMAHSQNDLSGLERFLRLLYASADGPRHLTVYSAWTADLSGENRKTIYERKVRLDLGGFRLFFAVTTSFRGRWGILNTSAILLGYRSVDFCACANTLRT